MKRNAIKKTTLDNLAHMVARGFQSVKTDLEAIEKRLINKIEEVEEVLTNRINGVERRIDDLALNRATRDEVYKIDRRLIRMERKVGTEK
ncbi:MAG: hypothetical protein A3G47_00690 [Candidatus Zambryskibacteria bacterium RIFCSPLOWO2_12_FULL_39_45]|uniref:Uncharacterized protein n=3 Tax=Candidatus Zambryskiibacteriota TaxID=1817925 RepID=A0A1G2T8F5_9BACT|nr:MAG: hypothetical protein UT81_C0013G0006 [Parcubacteria group bacterium GW2011_GWA2_40_14]OHA92891.1 MAG: hypothetical protein A2W58_00030 [Candidatus Zambryskibacteria bacterium RIFCSPHIGHO2_02_38_10.5]OHA96226.1 MAG: hypothetical protein A3C63_02750 [Candidatus Zambryskibacteria bacterium RIFCSPHIGHO2_02_FULL_39_82]OHA98434.1 MAG: hypothetical protein A3E32_01965 [Candidatus Zambryskibacteria bacterium RIFCSPHIGHO2_12_FULL_38_37]OHB08730.1 MAG: hypothetical protein A2W64_03665 [Candidatus